MALIACHLQLHAAISPALRGPAVSTRHSPISSHLPHPRIRLSATAKANARLTTGGQFKHAFVKPNAMGHGVNAFQALTGNQSAALHMPAGDTSLFQASFLQSVLLPISSHGTQTKRVGRSVDKGPANARKTIACSQRTPVSATVADVKASKNGTAIIWLKRDLRLDDHPGFAEALSAKAALPVYVFDLASLADLPEKTVVAIHEGVVDVQRSLQRRGSNLAVAVGSAQEILPELADKLGAQVVIAEDEVEHTWREMSRSVESALGSQDVRLRPWTLQLFSPSGKTFPTNYKQFTKLRPSPLPPLDAPAKLPPTPNVPMSTAVPSLDDLLDQIDGYRERNNIPSMAGSESGEGQELDSDEKLDMENRYWGDGLYEMRGGESVAQDALNGYLRFSEATKNETWYRMYSLVCELEERPLTSFPAIFGEALEVGWLSRRRVYHTAMQYEKERSGGRQSPFGFSAISAEAAVRTAELADFHWQLALNGLVSTEEWLTESRTWRWRGFLTQYTQKGDSGPAVLLVHGFGAFHQHFERTIDHVSGECRVWAITLPGFGRSEKPRRRYSQELWAEFLADFIAHVIKEPVVLVGNSIGGFCSSTLAADYSHLVKGLVLLNSAGRIVPGYSLPPPTATPEKTFGENLPSFVPWGVARVLFAYLDGNVDKILRRCYPKKPEAIRPWFVEEIKRAAADPGSIDVFESVFYLPKPRPINYLIDQFGGPVLVVQGRFDPLNDAVKRAEAIRAACPSVTVHFVDAGHCPMDEAASDVSAHIANFARDPSAGQDSDAPRPGKVEREEQGSAADVIVELAGGSAPFKR